MYTLVISALRSFRNYMALENYSKRLKEEVTMRKQAEKEKETVIENLNKAIRNIRTLSGLLPICSHCKKIKDEKGKWHKLELYLYEHSEADFSHGICPECAEELYGDEDWYQDRKNE